MLRNSTMGYARFISSDNNMLVGGVHGTWDDHDYGGNDRGGELKGKEKSRDAYLDFLGVPKENSARRNRRGVYGSVEFGSNDKVKIIFLDTRWHRDPHCIPSVGSSRYIPLGAIVACTTRWLTAVLDLPSLLPSWCSCHIDSAMLGEEQWKWFEQESERSTASMHVVVSSIQVLTTNPVVESWGHFPKEQERLLKVLNRVPGLVILSGDVHHAEISVSLQRNNEPIRETCYDNERKMVSNNGAFMEVTSSGLTHSCDESFYGPLCRPVLDAFPKHRFKGGNTKDLDAQSYFTSRNFGCELFSFLDDFHVCVH